VGDDKSYRVSFDEATGIARTDWLAGAVCGLGEAQEVDAEITALHRGKVLSLVDLREVGSIDRSAREFFMDQNERYRAVALLVGSPATRMLANFFLGLKRGSIPVRMFVSEEDAITWLCGQP
jgi:hypothetical protein